ncbi:YdeI/OmpD-associated family protein [Myxococcus sp. XM-1-1-1]|uniref:YdeI/OmpD-associated family protein n=1 Tax=Myxococcus sp. XM-1-1-1 TaxID=2874602 RepID=UPI00351CFCE1
MSPAREPRSSTKQSSRPASKRGKTTAPVKAARNALAAKSVAPQTPPRGARGGKSSAPKPSASAATGKSSATKPTASTAPRKAGARKTLASAVTHKSPAAKPTTSAARNPPMPSKSAPAATKTPSAPAPTDGLPIVFFETPAAFDRWMEKHHTSRGAWLKFTKKGHSPTSVTYQEALEVALIWGWIDGQKGRFDETAYLLRFTPRGPRSIWSKINREKVLALIDAGKMRPTGLAEVENAKKNGRWDAAYDSARTSTVPEDLAQALAANPRAQAFFATLNSVNRYAILFRVQNVKKAETRARKIAEYVDMLARNEKIHT